MNKRGFTIVWKVRRIAREKNIKNPHQLSLKTQLTYSSVLELWNNKATGINIVTLEILKLHLDCNVTDLYQLKWKTPKQIQLS